MDGRGSSTATWYKGFSDELRTIIRKRPPGVEILFRLAVFALVYVLAVLFCWGSSSLRQSDSLLISFIEFPITAASGNPMVWLFLLTEYAIWLVVLTQYVPVIAVILLGALKPTRSDFKKALAWFILFMVLWVMFAGM